MGQSLVKNYIHLVFGTKYRKPWIQPPLASELHAYIGAICKNLECHVITVGGYTDHIHNIIAQSNIIFPPIPISL